MNISRHRREALPRIDLAGPDRDRLLPLCRLKPGEIWQDPIVGHRVGVLDATSQEDVRRLTAGETVGLALNDPPYNFSVGGRRSTDLFQVSITEYMDFSRKWISAQLGSLADDAAFYVWTGADQRRGFAPLADLVILMREFEELSSRNFITLRNQRGYGTPMNWMSIRQELLYYTKGSPPFQPVYTLIPRILKGYYKSVGGSIRDNDARSRSPTIRAGNVWVDIQQVFYRLAENVPGAYAQKPLAAVERILAASSRAGDKVLDCFSHSGTTLIACERSGRVCYTCDVDPVFAEITIRRIEHFRQSGRTGWQWQSPFAEPEC